MTSILFSGILFDLDGTLLDTAPEFKVCLNQLLQEESRPILSDKLPPYALTVAVNHGLEALIQLGFGYDLESSYFEMLKNRLSDYYFNQLGQYSILFPGIQLCLDHLNNHQIPWGIVTNKFQKYTLALIEKIPLFQSAQIVVSGDTLAYAKPHPAPLYHACDKMNLALAKTLYVGDAKRDMEAAIAAGMPCALATYGYLSPDDELHKWGAHYHIHHPERILELMIR